MERVEHVLFGNGQKGLDQVAREFFAAWQAREDIKEKAEADRNEEMRRLDRKWNLRVTIIAVVVSALLGLMNLVGPFVRKFFNLPVVQNNPPALSSNSDQPQSAGDPLAEVHEYAK